MFTRGQFFRYLPNPFAKFSAGAGEIANWDILRKLKNLASHGSTKDPEGPSIWLSRQHLEAQATIMMP